MRQFTFHLWDRRFDDFAVAHLTLRDQNRARAQAALHLSASPHFECVDVHEGEDRLFTVRAGEPIEARLG